MKRCLASLVMKIKATVTYTTIHLLESSKLEILIVPSVCEDVEELELLHYWNIKWYHHLIKQLASFLKS